MTRFFLFYSKSLRTFLILGLVVFLILAARLAPGGLELTVRLVKEDRTILTLPLNSGERFTIHYNHSVENAPIWETHTMDADGTIFIEEEKYEKFGAGMGKMPGVGRMVMDGRYEVITDMHMPTGDFVLRVGSVGVDHTILWRGQKFNLSQNYAHKAVKFSGKPVSLLEQIFTKARIHIKKLVI